MGGKQTRSGKYFYICLALLIGVSVANCSHFSDVRKPEEGPQWHLATAQKFMQEGKYEEAVRENQKALFLSGNNSPGDQALFNIALVYANPTNPRKDYTQSVMSFTLLTREYPKSPLADQARAWTEVLQENVKLKRATQDALQENTKLKRATQDAHHEVARLRRAQQDALQENAKLKRVIEESKKVDLEITEMRRKK